MFSLSSFQAGKSYEQLKQELGDTAAITRITAVSFLEEQVTKATRAREKQQMLIDATGVKPYHVLLSITLVVSSDMKIVLTSRKAGLRAKFLILLPSRI